jgi:hypothetical protein
MSWQYQDISISFVMEVLESELHTSENMVETISLSIQYDPSLVKNRSLFQDYTKNLFIISTGNFNSVDSLQIIDYTSPSIISK